MKRTIVFAAVAFAANSIYPQGRGGAQSAQAAAPIDLTGYWVSVITEDWRYRMMTPAKGDYPSIPLNAEGRKIADAWDPAKDEAEGNQCRGYGGGAIMRMPGRFHITWQDANTLKVETDTGMQTRLFHFGRPQPPSSAPDWQGFSVAQWEFAGGGGRGRAGASQGGDLQVVFIEARRDSERSSTTSAMTEDRAAMRFPGRLSMSTGCCSSPLRIQTATGTSGGTRLAIVRSGSRSAATITRFKRAEP